MPHYYFEVHILIYLKLTPPESQLHLLVDIKPYQLTMQHTSYWGYGSYCKHRQCVARVQAHSNLLYQVKLVNKEQSAWPSTLLYILTNDSYNFLIFNISPHFNSLFNLKLSMKKYPH